MIQDHCDACWKGTKLVKSRVSKWSCRQRAGGEHRQGHGSPVRLNPGPVLYVKKMLNW